MHQYGIKAVTSCSTHKIDQQETDGQNSKIRQSRSTLDQSRGRKTDGGTRRSQRRGEEGATLVTLDQPFRHCTNQNQHPESGCWISLVHI